MNQPKSRNPSTAPSNPRVSKNYTKAPNIFLRAQLRLRPLERLILIYILSYKPCFVGQAQIAKDLGTSRNSVQRSLTNLVKLNMVGTQQRQGWSVYYFIKPRSEWKLSN
jgi:predicted transcriptional regulator